jgi:hypothetical protein
MAKHYPKNYRRLKNALALAEFRMTQQANRHGR